MHLSVCLLDASTGAYVAARVPYKQMPMHKKCSSAPGPGIGPLRSLLFRGAVPGECCVYTCQYSMPACVHTGGGARRQLATTAHMHASLTYRSLVRVAWSTCSLAAAQWQRMSCTRHLVSCSPRSPWSARVKGIAARKKDGEGPGEDSGATHRWPSSLSRLCGPARPPKHAGCSTLYQQHQQCCSYTGLSGYSRQSSSMALTPLLRSMCARQGVRPSLPSDTHPCPASRIRRQPWSSASSALVFPDQTWRKEGSSRRGEALSVARRRFKQQGCKALACLHMHAFSVCQCRALRACLSILVVSSIPTVICYGPRGAFKAC